MKKIVAILIDMLNRTAISKCKRNDGTRCKWRQSARVKGRENSWMILSTSSGNSITLKGYFTFKDQIMV